ncbi:diacylglycerol kinase [Aliiglaciecola lipolytica]|uniref:Diacylglycerol kinase n=1 Tax=Aliiglaciecola lipolytica E3 TaxID=1127673 RepID=K6Z0A3_9ALTE|nr:diacylglycerol kinase [Aliiglaciecola lipolytica]GAC16880.1 diacylglycerol kinase [Aliiglaciecola lipolytica E3]
MIFDRDNKPKGIRRIYLATLNSLRAIQWLMKNEAAFRQESMLLLIAIPSSFYVTENIIMQFGLILSVIFVLLMEIINTAIEVVVDRVSLDIHPLSGLAKDLGSALVMISMIVALVLWCVAIFNF